MSEIQQLIQKIQVFMAGKNRSFQPDLKLMYERYREQCVELCDLIGRCRAMRENGASFEARRYNLSLRPSLVERFKILNIAEREEFVGLCEDYGLPAMPIWDEETVTWLQSPVSDGEMTTSSLLEYWRGMARKGSALEKQAVLRQLVKQVKDVQWRKNLSEIEHLRCREIERELSEIEGKENEKSQLETYLNELESPDRITLPPGALLEQIKQRLRPLQQKADVCELDRILGEIVRCNGAQDLAGMEQGCLRLEEFLARSELKLNGEQSQEVAEFKSFIAEKRQAEAREMQYTRLENELRALLDASASYQEVYDKYEELRRIEDHEIPTILVEQVQRRTEEQEHLTQQRHIRHCWYGVTFSIAFVILLFFVIRILTFRNQVRSTASVLTRLLQEEKYEEGLEMGQKLQKTSPKIFASSSVTACLEELEKARQERDERIASARAEFIQLMTEVSDLLKQGLIESPEVEKLLQRGDKLRNDLTDEQRKLLNDSQGNVARARDELRIKRENAFKAGFQEVTGQLAKNQQLLQSGQHDFELTSVKQNIKWTQSRFERLCEESKVDPIIVNKNKDLFAKQMETVHADVQQEEIYRAFVKRLAQPDSLDGYLQVISEYKGLPAMLQAQYQVAYQHYAEWLALKEDAALTGEYTADLTKIEEQLKTKGPRTPFLKEYSLNGKRTSGVLLEQQLENIDLYKMYEIQLKCGAGPLLSFYCQEPPVLEWSKEYSGHLRYLYFLASLQAKGSLALIVLEYDSKATSFSVRSSAEAIQLKLPTQVTVKGMNAQGVTCNLMPTYALLEKLKSIQKAEAREAGAWQTLQKIIATETNTVLKYQLTREFLQGFSQWSSYYAEVLRNPLEQLGASPLAKEDWHRPSVDLEQVKKLEQVSRMLSQVQWQKFYISRLFHEHLIEAVHHHPLTPVGTLNVFNGKIQFVPFAGYRSQEMIVIENNKLHVLQSNCNGGKILPMDKELVFNGQLIWGYENGQSARDFLKYWRERADKEGIPLKIETALCPEEYKYFLKSSVN